MKKYQTITVRMPKELFKEIKEIAKREHRSMNQQINMYLVQRIEEKEPA